MSRYHEVYGDWQKDPAAFWAEAAKSIDWFRPFDKVFDRNRGLNGRWFVGAQCNTAYNCLDRHVAAQRGGDTALIYDSPVAKTKRSYSYAALCDEVAVFAAVLSDRGVEKGDRVIIYMPMVPEAVIAMLACARLGAIHSVVFGGFAAKELALRIDDAKPKVVVSASCGLEPGRVVKYKPLVDAAIDAAVHKPRSCIVLQRPIEEAPLIEGRDFEWETLAQAARAAGKRADCVPVEATDPLYILYTSGSTGEPKGIVRDNGGHMVALHWTMQNIYGVSPGEVFWAASDVGWVVGHSYIVYAPLLAGCTTLLYEGKPVGTPDAGAFWRVAAEHNVAALFTAPTAFRAIKKEDPAGQLIGKHDLTQLRSLFLAGERADPDTVAWAEDKLGIPVIDHWWQTETGWAIAANPVGLGPLSVKRGSASVPMPGYDVVVLDDDGDPVAPGTLGNIAIRLPLPPCCLTSLWNAGERLGPSYFEAFPGYYKTADAGYDGDPVPTIMALDVAQSGGIDNARTIFCGTFSKTLVPGLRVGWVCAARQLIDKLVLIKQASDLHSPSINQMVMYEVASEIFDQQVEHVRRAYRTRRDAMLAALDRHMPAGVSWQAPEGGMFIWLSLPQDIDAKELLAESVKKARVAFVPGGAFFADGSGANTTRLSFSLAEPEEIEAGISRLGQLLAGG